MTRLALADSFIDALAHLDAVDAKRAAAFVDKLLDEPARAGFNFEMIHEARDRTLRSARVSRDLRAIVHVSKDGLLLLFVGPHDVAYEWARNRCVECHPVTGELQVVETPDVAGKRLPEGRGAGTGFSPTNVPPTPSVFDAFSDEYLLSLGVPPSWLATIRMIRSDEMFLAVSDGLPDDVAERLLRVMEGELVSPPEPVCGDDECVWTTPAARRWICTVADGSSLCQLLDEAGIEHDLTH